MPIKTAVAAMNFMLESKEFPFLLFLLLVHLFPNSSFLITEYFRKRRIDAPVFF